MTALSVANIGVPAVVYTVLAARARLSKPKVCELTALAGMVTGTVASPMGLLLLAELGAAVSGEPQIQVAILMTACLSYAAMAIYENCGVYRVFKGFGHTTVPQALLVLATVNLASGLLLLEARSRERNSNIVVFIPRGQNQEDGR